MNTTDPEVTMPVGVLTAYDCWSLLEDEDVARIAWATDEGVAIVPVNYHVFDGALWFRAKPSSAVARQCADSAVAVEIDHVDREAGTAWSVVVTGTAEIVGDPIPPEVASMELWAPGSRTFVIRVHPASVTGRRFWSR